MMFHVEQVSRRMDYHLHTVHSFDGVQSVDELCREMIARGVEEICLTEHLEPNHPDPEVNVPPIWDVYFREIENARRAYPLLTIRAGVEIGDEPASRCSVLRDLSEYPFDFYLLSLHLVGGVDCYDAERFYAGKTRAGAYREYAEAKAESVMAFEDYDAVAHIGYVSRYAPWSDSRPLRYEDAPDVFDAMLRHMVEHGKCLEINTSTLETMGCTLPHESIIRRYIALGGEMFTFGSDAHDTQSDYRGIERTRERVRELGGKYQASFERRKMKLWRI